MCLFTMYVQSLGDWKVTSDPLELELQIVVTLQIDARN